MSDIEEGPSLEDEILTVAEFLDEFLGKLAQNVELDPINQKIDFTNYEDDYQRLISSITLKESKKLIIELGSSRALATLINSQDSENDYNLKQIGFLIELTFYLKEKDDCQFDLPVVLIKTTLREARVEWLLKFWAFLELRIQSIKQTKANEMLQIGKYPGVDLIIAINLRLKQLESNNEPQRDFLRAKLLQLTTDIFPKFDKFLINRRFNVNRERLHELKNVRNHRQFALFWNLQRIFSNPFEEFQLHPQRSCHDLHTELNFIFDIEKRMNPSSFDARSTKFQDVTYNNSVDVYEKAHLSDAKKREIQNYYDKKTYNFQFLLSDAKFLDQFKEDQNMRRAVLVQIVVLVCFLINILDDVPNLKNLFKELKLSLRPVSSNLRDLKKRSQLLLQKIDRKIYFTLNSIREFSELSWIVQKVNLFKEIDQEKYEKFYVDQNLRDELSKRAAVKNRYWALWGTPGLSKHWKTETGLDLLKKGKSDDSLKDINNKIEFLREKINDESLDPQQKELDNWKALRLARKTKLFRFRDVNETTGLEGLFDPSLKKKYDEEKQKREVIENAERERLREERRDRNEKERIEREAVEQNARDELERKRKASMEQFEEESKRARVQSASSAADASDDLDY